MKKDNTDANWNELVGEFRWCFGSYSFAISHVEPELEWDARRLITRRISKEVLKGVALLCQEWARSTIPSDTKSDLRFLGEIGSKRNWKSGCAICLTDKIMGTTCGCGHTEIAVLRPCGHAICASPCFQQWMSTTYQTTFSDTKNTLANGKQYTIPGHKNINQKIQVPCPICRVKTSSTFRAEEAPLTADPDLTKLKTSITLKLMSEMNPFDHDLAKLVQK